MHRTYKFINYTTNMYGSTPINIHIRLDLHPKSKCNFPFVHKWTKSGFWIWKQIEKTSPKWIEANLYLLEKSRKTKKCGELTYNLLKYGRVSNNITTSTFLAHTHVTDLTIKLYIQRYCVVHTIIQNSKFKVHEFEYATPK